MQEHEEHLIRIVPKGRSKPMDRGQCASIYRDAHSAACHAADLIKTPYREVTQRNGKRMFYPEPRLRGVAWIDLRNPDFSKWARMERLTGLTNDSRIWVMAYGTDLEKKLTYATTFVHLLMAHGVKAYAHCREE